jgi:hypothetical protein
VTQPAHVQLPSASLHEPPAPHALRSLHVAPPQQGLLHTQWPLGLHAPLHAEGLGVEQSPPPQQPSQLHAPVAQSQEPLPLHSSSEPADVGQVGGAPTLGTSDNTCPVSRGARKGVPRAR